MNSNFKNYLLETTQSSACKELEVIQSLWSGYGKISRYQLVGAPYKTVVVKCIALHQLGNARNSSYSHQRKVRSYQVETHWYENWSQRCTTDCRIPKFLGSFSEAQDQWIILEDLQEAFPLRKYRLDFSEVRVCLKWLAHFHATFLNQQPKGLWKVGTYWNLDTRPEELEAMKHPALKAKAHLIDQLLNQCQYQTIVHGDAKLANFCFSKDGQTLAAVDFQYVGGGCGMKDVAYFFGSALSSAECEYYEEELLDFYFSTLQKALTKTSPNIDFQALEKEWRYLYPIACTDFTRFFMGWMPGQQIDDYNLGLMNAVLSGL